MRTRTTSRRSGFTIVEIVVAMGVLLLGMSAILGLLSFGAAMTRAAQLRGSSSTAVEAIVADLEDTLFPILRDPQTGAWSVGEPATIDERPVPGVKGVTYSAKPVPDPREIGSPDGALRYLVNVEMRFSSGGRQRTVKFQTLLLRQVPFGERLRREFIEKRVDAPPPAATETKP